MLHTVYLGYDKPECTVTHNHRWLSTLCRRISWDFSLGNQAVHLYRSSYIVPYLQGSYARLDVSKLVVKSTGAILWTENRADPVLDPWYLHGRRAYVAGHSTLQILVAGPLHRSRVVQLINFLEGNPIGMPESRTTYCSDVWRCTVDSLTVSLLSMQYGET